MKKSLLFIFIVVISVTLSGFNNAVILDGTDDYIEINDVSSLLAPASSYSIECWFSGDDITTETGNQILWGVNGPVSNPNTNIMMVAVHGNVLKVYDGNNVGAFTGTTIIEQEVWYHVALSKQTDNTFTLYLNGIEELTGTIVTEIQSTSTFSIGQEWDQTPSDFFDGKIDEFRVWNYNRTNVEILRNMHQELIGNESGLLAYYDFNEASGTIVYDVTSNNNNGTLTNTDGNEWQTSSAIYGPKYCLEMDGIDDYVDCGIITNPSFLTSLTLECWVNIDVVNHYNRIITQDYVDTSETGLGWLATNLDGTVYTYLGGALQSTSQALNADEWNHIALVWDGTTIVFYINGHLDANSYSVESLQSCNSNIYLGWGGRYNNTHFDGEMDEVRIWSSARTSNQIREDMCQTLTGNESGLVAYYDFDNTSGQFLQDFSGNGFSGTLHSSITDDGWVPSNAFNTWLDTSNSNWSNESNWSNGAPDPTDNIAIYNLDTVPSISGAPTFNDLYLGNGVNVNLNSDMTINGNLILNSNLDLNGQTIVLGEQATLIENNGHLYGELGQIQTTRSLSNINDNVAGLGAVITEDGNLGTTTIIRGHKAQGHQGIDRYYQINPQNNPTAATLVFNYLDSELNGQNESIIKLFKSTDGVEWIEQDSELNAANNTITLTDIDSFSYWSAGQAGAGEALPITLSSFTVSLYNHLPTLSWTTESESNNLGWNVYRANSNDLAQTIRINEEFIHGSGNTSEQTQYTYYDNEPIVTGEEYYYWIESVGFGNEIKYHGPISILVGSEQPDEDNPEVSKEFGLFPNYPNPFNPSTTISFASEKSGNCELTVYDLRGRRVKTLFSGHVNAEVTNSIVWNGDDDNNKKVASGIYFYRLTGNGKTVNRKMTLMK